MGRSVRIALRLMTALGQIAAPALAAQVVFSQSAHGQTTAQTSLPPPPYASPVSRPTSYGGAQGYDRYGGGTVHARTPAPGGASVAAYAGPRLGWSGKTETVQRPQPQPQPQPQPARYVPSQPLPAAPAGWSYVPPIGARLVEPAATPTSIYESAPPLRQTAVAPRPTAAGGVRHYSLHSDFGVQPDPIPPPSQTVARGAEAGSLPSSFFGQSPDLSAPETPDPQRKVASANGKSRNALQPEAGQ